MVIRKGLVHMQRKLVVFLLMVSVSWQFAMGDDFKPERCEVIPLPGDQVSLRIDGVEKLGWHFGKQYPRPFFYPFNGPAGVSLTRMGHPGAQNHDHHRSVWFAHHRVNGLDFWSDNDGTHVRQKHWLRYRDGDNEAVMGVRLGWYDPQNVEVMEQDVVAALRPLEDDEFELELQITIRPPTDMETVTLEKTNFGLLAVRVSKTLSAYFGGGQLRSSEGGVGEPAIFGKPARWMDYCGPVVVGQEETRHVVSEGITFFDHPRNPRYPTHWHVREDGWMGASFTMNESFVVNRQDPLTLRYLLHAHNGEYDSAVAEAVHGRFASRPGFVIRRPKPGEKHRQFEIERLAGPKK